MRHKSSPAAEPSRSERLEAVSFRSLNVPRAESRRLQLKNETGEQGVATHGPEAGPQLNAGTLAGLERIQRDGRTS